MKDSELSLNGFQTVHLTEGAMLRERRMILGLTQQAVANRAKIPLQSYQQFESGKRNINRASFSIACRVLEALEMNISDFYHGEYTFGEKVFSSMEGLRYEKTKKLINDEAEVSNT